MEIQKTTKTVRWIFAVAMLLCMKTNAQQLTSQQANNLILQMYSDSIYDTYQIYRHNSIINTGENILSVFDTITIVENSSYVFFVDEAPYASWGHGCRYILVNTVSGDITSIHASMPPDLDEYAIIRGTSIKYNSEIIYPENTKGVYGGKQCDNSESQYAVIIHGGMNIDENHLRYWNDCSFMYNTLVHTYGYKKSNIYVLMTNGPDASNDVKQSKGKYGTLPRDLDNDGSNDVKYAANKQSISLVFDELSTRMKPGDNLFIYTMGHGNTTNDETYLCLWYDKISARDFATEVNKISEQCIVNTVMGQCFAGGFSGWLNMRENRVSTFAAPQNKPSFNYPNSPYDMFVYLFTSAINGRNPYGALVDADLNNDGEISMREAFVFARDNDPLDDPFQVFNNPYFPKVLTMCNKEGVDLVIQDTPDDNGKEPNTVSEYLYQSNDIYIRLQEDGFTHFEHQNPISGQTAYVYVKVHNNGYATYKSNNDNGEISLFWAKAGIGLSWPEPWQGSEINNIPLGGSLGFKPLINTLLPYYNGFIAGMDRIYCFEWQVPRIEDYADLPENWHFCLLAVMNSEIDPLTDEDCEGDLDKFVRNNNNVAWKNVTVINSEDAKEPAYISVTNWKHNAFKGEIIFESPKDETYPLLNKVAEIIITVDEELYKMILNNWSYTYGIEVCKDRDYSFVIRKDSASISNLVLEPQKMNLLGLSVEFLLDDKELEKQNFKYNISLKDLEKGCIIGGEQYSISRSEIPSGICVNAGEDQIIALGETATLSAENAGQEVSYMWIDAQCDTVINEQTVEVSPITTQRYRLKVKTDDGFIGYDSLNVVVKSNFIKSINPQPATDLAVIAYEASQADNVSIEIINNSGILVNVYRVSPTATQYSFDCSTLPSGVYTIMLNCDGRRMDAKVLIVE